jgi:hypothetical protein
VHEPPNHTYELQYGSEKQNSNDGRTFESLYVDDDNLNARDRHEDHGKIEEGEETFAFFCDWIFGMSAHIFVTN